MHFATGPHSRRKSGVHYGTSHLQSHQTLGIIVLNGSCQNTCEIDASVQRLDLEEGNQAEQVI